MSLFEREVLQGHKLQHVEHVPLGVVLAVPEQSICLSFCDLSQANGIADQFCNRLRRHFTLQ